MFLDIILISFIFAFLRGGRLREIPTFHKISFLGASILLQIVSAFFPLWGSFLVSVAYAFSLAFFYFNREFEDIRIFSIGWLLNALVIWSNLGKMPVDLNLAKKTSFPLNALLEGTDFKHTILTESTRLSFLGDILFLPFPIARVISIGDLFIMLGAFLLIQRIMNKPISLMRLREGKSHATTNQH